MLSRNQRIIAHGNANGFLLNGEWISSNSIHDGVLDSLMSGADSLYLCSCEVGQGSIPDLIEQRYGVPVFSSLTKLHGGQIWTLSHGDETVEIMEGLTYPSSLVLSYAEVDTLPYGNQDKLAITPLRNKVVVGRCDGTIGEGTAHIYDLSPSGTFTLVHTINESGIGLAVSISDDGNLVAVSGIGVLYVYQFFLGTWNLIGFQTGRGSFYGKNCKVSGDGSKVFVPASATFPGIIEVYDVVGSSLTPRSSGFINQNYPRCPGTLLAVSEDGNTVVSTEQSTSLVPIRFQWDGSTWTDVGNAFHPNPNDTKVFGLGMSSDGITLVVASDFDNLGNYGFNAYTWDGSFYVYKGSNTQWSVQPDSNVTVSDDGNRLTYGGYGITNNVMFWKWNSVTSLWDAIAGSPNQIDGSLVMTDNASHFILSESSKISSYMVVAPTPLVTTANDDFTTLVLNINADNQTLALIPSILDNDTVDPGAPPLTINTIGLDAQATVNPSGNISITSLHPTGAHNFTYNVTDSSSDVSNTSTVTYRVINFGPKTVADFLIPYPGDSITFTASDYVFFDGINPTDLTVTITASGGIQTPLIVSSGDGSTVFTLTGLEPGPAFFEVTFVDSVTGSNVYIYAAGSVGTPSVVVTDESMTLDGVVGETSLTSILDNEVFTPNDSSRFPFTISGAPSGVSINSLGFVTVDPGTTPGVYPIDYTYSYDFNGGTEPITWTGTLQLTVTGVSGTPIANPDDFTANRVNGDTGGVLAVSVLTNDSDDGNPPLTATLTSDGGLTGLTLSPTGFFTVPAGTPPGTYTAQYTIEDANSTINGPVDAIIYVFIEDTSGSFSANDLDITSFNETPDIPYDPIVYVRQDPRTVDEIVAIMLNGYTGPRTAEITAYIRATAPYYISTGHRIYQGQAGAGSASAFGIDHDTANDSAPN